YAVARDIDGGPALTSAAQFAPGRPFDLVLVDGTVRSRVDGTVPARVDGTMPARVDGTMPARVDGTMPARVDGTMPARVEPAPVDPLLADATRGAKRRAEAS
ncbi:MAG TPA: hypothetical protein VK733_05940, partial [Gemmatimonadaceae bacterium]|nr:hypothetical protein [Gemmatimonadaceae bacterium]